MAEYKIACPHCGIHVEFPAHMHGQVVACPECSMSMGLTVPGLVSPAASQPPPMIFTDPPKTVVYGKIKKKSEFIGTGCLVQGVGLIALFFFPIGTIIGILLLIAGSVMSSKFVCSNCGNRVSGSGVKVCPSCQAHF